MQLYTSVTSKPDENDVDIGEISDGKPDPPRIVRHNTQQIQIELFLSAPGSDFLNFYTVHNEIR